VRVQLCRLNIVTIATSHRKLIGGNSNRPLSSAPGVDVGANGETLRLNCGAVAERHLADGFVAEDSITCRAWFSQSVHRSVAKCDHHMEYRSYIPRSRRGIAYGLRIIPARLHAYSGDHSRSHSRIKNAKPYLKSYISPSEILYEM
jgi:hypothetical protein